ncbi:hypothetical protein [Microbacterium sp. NPDC058389]|uniref:hypothetical protein n=1 Tax=Microbacterium sp. NPDC058389 TaxID=3346475 RepID=UPI00365ADEE1
MVRSITSALSAGLDTSEPAEITANLGLLSDAVSHIDTEADSAEGEALGQVREAVDSLVQEGNNLVDGAPSEINDSVNSLIWTIGQLDKVCDGAILSTSAPL